MCKGDTLDHQFPTSSERFGSSDIRRPCFIPYSNNSCNVPLGRSTRVIATLVAMDGYLLFFASFLFSTRPER